MPIEGLFWFFMGVGSAIFIIMLARLIKAIIFLVRARKHMPSKFDAYVDGLREFGAQLSDPDKEISELTFRDKNGMLSTVRIVVDRAIELSEQDKENMRQMVARGDADAGSLDAIIAGANYEETDMHKVQNFVFSGHAADQMRARGIELDEVVRKMLKASGRIA